MKAIIEKSELKGEYFYRLNPSWLDPSLNSKKFSVISRFHKASEIQLLKVIFTEKRKTLCNLSKRVMSLLGPECELEISISISCPIE